MIRMGTLPFLLQAGLAYNAMQLSLLPVGFGLPVLDGGSPTESTSGLELLRGLLTGTDLGTHVKEDDCCHDALNTSLEFLGKYGSQLGNEVDLSKFTPDSHACTLEGNVTTELPTCTSLVLDETSAKMWDVWTFSKLPGFSFKVGSSTSM